MTKLHEVVPDKLLQLSAYKQYVRSLFMDTMEAVSLESKMTSLIFLDEGRLVLGPNSFPLGLFSRVLVIAVGKVAVPMAKHLQQVLAAWIDDRHHVEGIVVGNGAWDPTPGWTYVVGSHPVPNDNSFAAAELLLERVSSADEDTLVLFLVSGGASSMVETPLSPSILRQDAIDFYRLLLHAGLPIQKMNILRKHLSAVKGGRLALAAPRAVKATVLISDVPNGMLDAVGSGLSLPDPSVLEDCWQILRDTPHLKQEIPQSILEFLSAMPETPKEIPDGKLPYTCFSLLSSESLAEAASQIAAASGYRVVVDNTCDDWNYQDAAKYLLERARGERKHSSPICLLSAGEVTVSISGPTGVGGRNQQWVLEMARLLRQEGESYVVLSAGSDGADGNSPAAGAVADTWTWARAEAQGLHPQKALDEFDAYTFFEALQDTVVTRPFNNNLRDLRIILTGF